ncbi:tyrosine-type recombinase/integrase [Archaeoglobus sp.]
MKFCSYRIDDDRIIIYINELKKQFEPETVRKHIITIKRFLRFVNYPNTDMIKLPKIPKRRGVSIRPEHIKQIAEKADIKTRAAVLLAATSGLRAEELYKLTLDDIDIDNRTVYVRAEIAKDCEDRVTFFSEEARDVLLEYLDTGVRKSVYLFPEGTMQKKMRKISKKLRMKHMRKFFSQQSDRLGMPTSVKKLLMGHSLRGDVDLSRPLRLPG